MKMFTEINADINDSGSCQISFQLAMDQQGAKVMGMDLSLFMQNEDPNTNAFYYIFIVYKRHQFLYDIAGARVIHSACSGWQTFHIDPVKQILNFSNTYEHNITLLIAGRKEVEGELYSLKCDDISSLFILDQKLIIPSANQENHVEDTLGFKEYSHPTTTEEMEEGGSSFFSGEEAENMFPDEGSKTNKTEDEEEQNDSSSTDLLVPLITAFVEGESSFPRFRRNEDVEKEHTDNDEGKTTALNLDSSSKTKEEMKKEDKQGAESRSVKNHGTNVICELQDRVVNVTEYLKDSSIIEPQTFNIHQCSPSTNEQCPQCEPLYGKLEVLKQIYNHNLNQYMTIISEISNVTATGCRRNPSC